MRKTLHEIWNLRCKIVKINVVDFSIFHIKRLMEPVNLVLKFIVRLYFFRTNSTQCKLRMDEGLCSTFGAINSETNPGTFHHTTVIITFKNVDESV